MNKDNAYGLEINNEVLIKMASVATLEVEGVAGLVAKTTNIKEVFAKENAARAIKVTGVNGVTRLEIYISVYDSFDARIVAEQVQKNVKSKIQNMTGTVITEVNVIVADVANSKEAVED